MGTGIVSVCTLSLHDALPISAELNPRYHRTTADGTSIPDERLLRVALPALQTAGPSDRELQQRIGAVARDRKSTRLNSSHVEISYAVLCLKKKTGGFPGDAAT